MRRYQRATGTPSSRTRRFGCKVIRQKGIPDHLPDIGLSRCLHSNSPNASIIVQFLRSHSAKEHWGLLLFHTNDCQDQDQRFTYPAAPLEALSMQVALELPALHRAFTIRSPLPEEGEGGAVPMAAPWPAGHSRPRSGSTQSAPLSPGRHYNTIHTRIVVRPELLGPCAHSQRPRRGPSDPRQYLATTDDGFLPKRHTNRKRALSHRVGIVATRLLHGRSTNEYPAIEAMTSASPSGVDWRLRL